MSREPAAPPLPLGARVRYNGSSFGRWADPYDPSSIVWVNPGDVGEVVALHEGSPGMPGIDPEPLDGWSTVRFGAYAGNDRALTAQEFAACEPDEDEPSRCANHGGQLAGEGACSSAGRYEVLS